MTKWICKMCSHTCIIWMGGEYHSCPSRCIYVSPQADISKWERVDEPEAKRDDSLDAYKFVVAHIDEEKIEEAAYLMKNLKERVEALEKRQPVIVFDAAKRLERLEHQMRKHYHGGPVWCETEDGSGTERLVK